MHLFDKLEEGGAIKNPPPEPEQENWIPSNYKEKIKNASFHEREEYWQDTPEAERMGTWRSDMNAFLDNYKNDPTKKAGLTFLQKILKRDDQKTLGEVEVTADTVYRTFIEGEGRGDVEYYVRRVIEKTDCNRNEIEQNIFLITKLGGIYGKNYGKIATQLIHSILNTKKSPLPKDYTTIGTDLRKNMDVAISQKARQ